MFESDNSRSILTRSLVRTSAAADTYAQRAKRARQVGEQWEAYAHRLETRVSDLELALCVKTAHAGGLQAYLDEFKSAHPRSPVLADSGKRYKKSGNLKTVGSLLYERTFDRMAVEAGIASPLEYRAD
ncbi:hypothetical protein [Acidisphaera sp. S103]|uniref:hypothetical protein n=1 Tax=Acidisphaera sp. S103 TaxID=1747223 RepID=UPI00131C315B|nr:hypothetical protein [Acidisphaera sp. S103]